MRRVSMVAALVVSLTVAATATAARITLQIDRGVVQTISLSRITLRELDGSTVSIAVGPSTRVRLNGLPAAIADIEPGFVAAVAHDGAAPALAIRAFGRVARTLDAGVIVTRGGARLTIRTADGRSLTFRITLRTRIRWRRLPATVAALRPGRVAAVTHTAAGVALRIVVRAGIG